jgi:hypothetical protein
MYRPVGSFSTKSSSKSGESLVLKALSEGCNAKTEPEIILVAELKPNTTKSTRNNFQNFQSFKISKFKSIGWGFVSDWNREMLELNEEQE